MPARWPTSWDSAASSSRACRACCRPPACWPRPSSTKSPPRCRAPIDGLDLAEVRAHARPAGRRAAAVLMARENVADRRYRAALLRRRLLRRPGLSSGGAVRAGRRRPVRRAHDCVLRGPRPHLRLCAQVARPAGQPAHRAQRRGRDAICATIGLRPPSRRSCARRAFCCRSGSSPSRPRSTTAPR